MKTLIACAALAASALVLAARPHAAPTVTKVEITAGPKTYSGKCPTTVKWTAPIWVSEAPVTVEYRWERSDGAMTGTRRIKIDKMPGKSVTDTWQIGAAGEHTLTEKLHVLSPNDVSSPVFGVHVVCR